MLEPGLVLQGRYTIISHIGKGGMGSVYLAKDQNLGVTVAVKQNCFDEQRLIEAFKREARLLAGLRHSVLPQVKDYFIDNTGQYLVMEYIPGPDLWATLEERRMRMQPAGTPKPLDVDTVVRWAEQLLEALDYLHTRPEPVIHRDIKPQNLKIAERDQVILLDFGLAKGKPLWMTRVTTTGSLYGYTPNYAPIEQIRGVGTDPRSDLYALGATLYHLITGLPPVDAATRADAFLGGEPDPLRPANEVNSKVPQGIAQVLMKAMEPHRNNRPASAAEILEILRTAKQSTVVDWQARQERERIAERLRQEKEAWPTTEIEIHRREEERIRFEQAALREEEERKEREEAERKRREEQVRKLREEAERKQREEQERKTKEEAERKQREEQERRAREEAERFRLEQEKAERAAVEAEARRQREEADRKQREEQDRAAKEWAEEHLRQEEAERRALEEQEKLRLESERKIREDAARKKRQEENERKAKEEAERLRQQQEETRRQLEREDADRRIQQQREAGERVSVKKQGAAARIVAAVRGATAPGTELQRDWRNTLVGTVFLVILAFSIWYLVSTSNEAGSSKPVDGLGNGTPQTSQSTGSQEQAGLKPGPFATATRVVKIALSDDGRVLASVGDEARIRLWRTTGMTELSGHAQRARSVAVSHDGQVIASGWEDGTIRLWRVSDGSLVKSWSAHSGYVFSIGFSPDGNTLFSAGDDKNIKLWRVSDGVLIKTVKTSYKDFLIVAVSPDLQFALIYRKDGNFDSWSLSDDRYESTLIVNSLAVNCGAFSNDGQVVALGSKYGKVLIWRVADGRPIRALDLLSLKIMSMSFSADGQTLAVGLENGTIKLWRVSDGNLVKTLLGHNGSVNSLAFSADGRTLVSGSDDKTIRVWKGAEISDAAKQ